MTRRGKIIIIICSSVLAVIIGLCVLLVIGVTSLFSPGEAKFAKTEVVVSDLRNIAELSVISCHKDIIVQRKKTVRSLFSHEYRISVVYPCRISLGIDLSELTAESVVTDSLTGAISVKLPPVRILNKGQRVVDELSRRSISDGDTNIWTGEEMQSMRDEAERTFLQECRDDGLFERAAQQAADLLTAILRAMGYTVTTVIVDNHLMG